jgi:hypothetical protein
MEAAVLHLAARPPPQATRTDRHAGRLPPTPAGTSRVLPDAGGGWAAVQGVSGSAEITSDACGDSILNLKDNVCALDLEGKGDASRLLPCPRRLRPAAVPAHVTVCMRCPWPC